jgi:hypothetical protein
MWPRVIQDAHNGVGSVQQVALYVVSWGTVGVLCVRVVCAVSTGGWELVAFDEGHKWPCGLLSERSTLH